MGLSSFVSRLETAKIHFIIIYPSNHTVCNSAIQLFFIIYHHFPSLEWHCLGIPRFCANLPGCQCSGGSHNKRNKGRLPSGLTINLVLDFSGNIECFDPFDHSRSVSSKTRSTRGIIWESIAMGILLIILCNDSVETFQECDSRIPQTALPLSQALNKLAGGSIPLQNIEVTAVCFWPWKSHWLVASCITASLPYLTFFDHILPYLTTVSWCEEVAVSVRFHQTGRPGSS